MVARGVTRAFRNATETPVRFLNAHWPALTFQDFLETVDRLIRAGKITRRTNLRSGIYLSLAAVEQGTSVQIRPPETVIRRLTERGRRLLGSRRCVCVLRSSCWR